ncbi:hypothetical protein [Streptomyces thioluteus]|uniref:hypothetical protein n=1 Tax=Streptomyces thioluteus TaxID=66431 RepID=UPI0031F0A733
MTTHLRRGVGPRVLLALVAALCGIIGATALGTTPATAADQRHAIYAIAHRVDTLDGVDAALKHGANAIEIDVCAWWNPNEWRAYHDCSSAGETRHGPSFDSMIDRIVSNARAGRRLALVWLDIKDPNYCGEAPNRACSVAGLRDKAQRLTGAGIQVLYGFYEYHGGSTPDVGGRGWKSLEGKLGKLEGITTTGTRDQVLGAFNRSRCRVPGRSAGDGLRRLRHHQGVRQLHRSRSQHVCGTEEGRRGPCRRAARGHAVLDDHVQRPVVRRQIAGRCARGRHHRGLWRLHRSARVRRQLEVRQCHQARP